MSEVKDNVDREKCSRCGGECCRIYTRVLDGGVMPSEAWFEEWVGHWDEAFEASGAKLVASPLFDPLLVHLAGNEGMLDDLTARGIDPHACQYLGKDGCLLPRGNRPRACREFLCEGKTLWATGATCEATP